MGDESGSPTGIDRLVVCFPDCVHRFSPWSGTTFFLAVIQICRPNMSPEKIYISVFLDISASASRVLKLFRPVYAILDHGQ